MTLKDFQWGKEISVQQYHQPLTIPEALDMLSRYHGKARIIAGGTDVIPLLRRGDLRADALIDITRLPRMNDIEADGESICLGGIGDPCAGLFLRLDPGEGGISWPRRPEPWGLLKSETSPPLPAISFPANRQRTPPYLSWP